MPGARKSTSPAAVSRAFENGSFVYDYYLRVMLPYEGITTEQIISHNFEKLLENELSN